MHSGDFLFHGGKETLWIEEPSEPVSVGSSRFHPSI